MQKNYKFWGMELVINTSQTEIISGYDKLMKYLEEVKGKRLEIYIDALNFSLNSEIDKGWELEVNNEWLSIGSNFKIDTDEIDEVELYKEYSNDKNNHSSFRVIMDTKEKLYFYAYDNLDTQ